MPKTDTITLQVVDLDNIIQGLIAHPAPGGIFQIVDANEKLIIRDQQGMKLFEIQKTMENQV